MPKELSVSQLSPTELALKAPEPTKVIAALIAHDLTRQINERVLEWVGKPDSSQREWTADAFRVIFTSVYAQMK